MANHTFNLVSNKESIPEVPGFEVKSPCIVIVIYLGNEFTSSNSWQGNRIAPINSTVSINCARIFLHFNTNVCCTTVVHKP